MATRNSALTSWTKRTNMFVHPSSDGWTVNGYNFYSVANGILHADSITPGVGNTGYLSISPNLKKSVGWTCEWRMRIINVAASFGNNTCIFQITDDCTYNNVRFYNDRVNWEQPGTSYVFDTTDAFHVYKLQRAPGNNTITLYVDGVSRLTHTDAGSGATSGINMFFDADGANGFQADLDYFHYKNTGNYPNPPLTMGRRAVT